MSTYSPEYISQVMSFVSGDTVTADEFNTILNKVIHQGDHNSEWLNYLDKVGIPAAVAEITVGDIQEYIEDTVDEEIQALTVGSASRTTGFTTSKDLVIINTGTAVDADDFVGINNKWIANTTAPDNPICAGYSGSDIVNMTSENRATDCASARAAISNLGTPAFSAIYQSRTATSGIDKDYLVGNLACYLYKAANFKTYSAVYADNHTGHEMQFPVVEFNDTTSIVTALSNVSIDTCPIVAAPLGELTSAELATLRTAITTLGFNIITVQQFLVKWLNNLYNGTNVYATALSAGRQQVYSNVLTAKTRFCVDKADGTAALFDYTDILKLSEDELTFTNVNGSLVVTDAAGNTKITYTPTEAVIDNTLVGTYTTTSELPVLVAAAGNQSTSTGSSYTNNTVKVGNGTLKINNKNVPFVQSYDSTTGTLVLGGL